MNLSALNDPAVWTSVLLPIVGVVVVLVAGYVLARVAQRAVVHWMPRAGASAVTFAPLLGQATRYGIIVLAIITALGFVGVPATTIFTVVGSVGLAVALALQNTLSNVAAGIMLAWIRPIAVGDYVTGDGVEGVVVEIGLFGTRLRSTSGLYVFCNNNRMWNGPITNHTREPRRRIDVNVTIPDTANLARVRKTLLGLATRDKRVLPEPAPVVIVSTFNKDTVSLQMRAWVATPDYRAALRDLTEAAKVGVNKLLATGDGGTAEVTEAEDPHVAQSHARTPDLG